VVDGFRVDLSGRVAVVTGGGTGIGRATSVLLAQCGADVVVAGRTERSLRGTVDLVLRSTGRKALPVVTDVRVQAQVRDLIDRTVEHFSRLDILVNNAGGTYLRPLPAVRVSEWDNNIALNLNSVFLATQAALAPLTAARGCIVNISSSAGSTGFRTGSAYSTAKSGVEMFTRVSAAELGAMGIRVNCVAPGMVRSEGAERSWQRGKMDVAAEARNIPIGRVGEPEEIASAVVFLASGAASFITGEVLHVDGGPRMDGPRLDEPR
jgi:NAD(P)-dependent dehydrogenase (short-subunit alcohol dehydrogenase family)